MQRVSYRQLLTDELSRRCAKNPRYSLRAFATALGVDPGNLSRAMRGQSNLSVEYARRIATALALSPTAASELLESSTRSRRSERGSASRRRAAAVTDSFTLVESTLFDVIADPLHYAILELTAVQGFKSDVKWIAKVLGVTQITVKLAVQRLEATGLLSLSAGGETGRWKKLTPRLKTPGGKTTSAALRRHQKRVLQAAADAVDDVPVDQRCNVSFTMPIDPALMETARLEIEAFAAGLCRRLSRGKRERVYQLGVCLYPVQKLLER